jgi:hypothetical protein
MFCQLPNIQSSTALAGILNAYIDNLQPSANVVAPRLSFRQRSFTDSSEPYHSAAELFYSLHITAGALVHLHDAYTGAVAAWEALGGDNSRVDDVRDALAPYFATSASVDERIGSGCPDDVRSATELVPFARKMARALGLPTPAHTRGTQAAADPAFPAIRQLLSEGQTLAALYLTAETLADYGHLISLLRRVLTAKF